MRIYHRMQMQKIFLVSGAVMNSFFFTGTLTGLISFSLEKLAACSGRRLQVVLPDARTETKQKKTHSENDIH